MIYDHKSCRAISPTTCQRSNREMQALTINQSAARAAERPSDDCLLEGCHNNAMSKPTSHVVAENLMSSLAMLLSGSPSLNMPSDSSCRRAHERDSTRDRDRGRAGSRQPYSSRGSRQEPRDSREARKDSRSGRNDRTRDRDSRRSRDRGSRRSPERRDRAAR